MEAKEAGFLDVRSSDIIFQITAPEFRQVISKRRKYIDKIIENNEVPRQLKRHVELIDVLNWHLTRLVLSDNDFVRLLVTTFSLNNIRFGLQMLRDYYTSNHSTFHEFYQNHPNITCIDEYVRLDYSQESSRMLQSLMLGNSWSYEESQSEIFNVFWVSPLEKTSHFLLLRILAYLSIERDITSARVSAKYDKVCNDFISLGFQRHHVDNAIRRLLYAGLIVSPNLPDTVTETRLEIPDPLPREMKIVISGRGHYYLKKLASHPYYQTRIGEDTVWYDAKAANEYVQCLKESFEQQIAGASDLLQATEARNIFLNYLKNSLLQEVQSQIRFTSADWSQLMNDIVERNVFGETVTKPIEIKNEKEALATAKDILKEVLARLENIDSNDADNNEEKRKQI